MPSIGGRPSADEFAERSADDPEEGPPAGFGTDRLSKLAVLGTFPILWLGRYGGYPLWLATVLAAFYLFVATRAGILGRPVAALGWGLYLPALALSTERFLPAVGSLVGVGLVVVGLVTVAYADYRCRRDERTETTP